MSKVAEAFIHETSHSAAGQFTLGPKTYIRVMIESSVNDGYFFVSRLRLVEEIFATTFELMCWSRFQLYWRGELKLRESTKSLNWGRGFAVLRGGVSVFVYIYVFLLQYIPNNYLYNIGIFLLS